MALLNNWDLTDENNAAYQEEYDGAPREVFWLPTWAQPSALAGLTWPLSRSRGNLTPIATLGFITRTHRRLRRFSNSRASFLVFPFHPHEYAHKTCNPLDRRRHPRADAKWVGQLLSQLSPRQIRDAFRAAGI